MNIKFSKSLIGVLLVLLIALAGCTSNGEKASTEKDPKAAEKAKAKEPAKLKVALETGGAAYVQGNEDINNDEYVKNLEKLANVDLTLEVLPHENYEQNMQLLLAGGELPDLLQTKGINRPEIAPALDAGVLMPLNDLLEKHGKNLLKAIPKESWDNPRVSKDGQIFGIPQENPVLNSTVTYIRKDWLDKLGLEVPKTVDEYIEVLRAFKTKDPNGNGIQDEIPFSARKNFSFGYSFFGAYDAQPQAWSYQDGKLVPNFIKPEMKEALKVYRTLYKEKLLDNEFLVQEGKDWDAKIIGAGLVGMWAHSSAAPDSWLTKINESHPDAKIAIIPSPVIPGGKPGGVYPLGSSVSDFVWTIPAGSKNAEETIKFLDWFYQQGNEEADNFFLYGLEGKDHTVENGEINYKYPTSNEEAGRQFMYQQWIHFTGPKEYLTNEEFVKNKVHGELIYDSLKVANQEGLIDDGADMPAMETLKARPELAYDGLWLEFAAKVVTGKESVDKFDEFVANWEKRGGDKLIDEATKWYKENRK
ncbi:ABC transporter substrate-binding protein [Bacillus sp. FJAT-27225]|uniref:extracellular solute-binding protein n=1 Tax=Bacillus sp. FJAT-27225 TaxID=1743144 RepID=UPI00080C21D2|nr:extracellular solute-binding protein [Bacillus sp. FJAT-27225]OCA85975.1 ABC transporter substrate-binding protein [Bacillus sp. FJAT-27225]